MGNGKSSSQYDAIQVETTILNQSCHHLTSTSTDTQTKQEQEQLSTNHRNLMFEPGVFAVPELLNEIYINYDCRLLFSGQDIIDMITVPENLPLPRIEGNTLLVTIDPKMYFVRGFLYPHSSSLLQWPQLKCPDTPLWKLRQEMWALTVVMQSVTLSDVFQRHYGQFHCIPFHFVDMYDTTVDEWRQYWIKKIYNNVITTKRAYDVQGKTQMRPCDGLWIPAYQVLDPKMLQSSIQAHQAKLNSLQHQLLKYSLKE
jgi:hypothetical protein